jgi:hypothetical protein
LSDDDKINLSEVITEHLIKKIERENTEKRRPPITQKIRKELISIYGDRPRCWLTGYQFSSQAVEKFIDSDPRELPLPLYVDIHRVLSVQLSFRSSLRTIITGLSGC